MSKTKMLISLIWIIIHSPFIAAGFAFRSVMHAVETGCDLYAKFVGWMDK